MAFNLAPNQVQRTCRYVARYMVHLRSVRELSSPGGHNQKLQILGHWQQVLHTTSFMSHMTSIPSLRLNRQAHSFGRKEVLKEEGNNYTNLEFSSSERLLSS
ncbi:unnamed protein product [Calypogeia fissa]